MNHQCHALGCKIEVPRERLMCRRHWFMVPKPIRDDVWATYRAGQCDLNPPPSAEWHAAADAAIAEVARKEGGKQS